MNQHDQPHELPFEVEFAHALLPLLEILGRDMDDACQHLLHRARTDQRSVYYRAADAAQATVRAWARLVRELRRYENTRWWVHSPSNINPDEPF